MSFCEADDAVDVELRNMKVIESEYKWTLEVLSSAPKEGAQIVWSNYDAQTKWWRHHDGSLHLSGNPNLFVGCGPCYDQEQEGEVQLILVNKKSADRCVFGESSEFE